jgi:hypothetical protein
MEQQAQQAAVMLSPCFDASMSPAPGGLSPMTSRPSLVRRIPSLASQMPQVGAPSAVSHRTHAMQLCCCCLPPPLQIGCQPTAVPA